MGLNSPISMIRLGLQHGQGWVIFFSCGPLPQLNSVGSGTEWVTGLFSSYTINASPPYTGMPKCLNNHGDDTGCQNPSQWKTKTLILHGQNYGCRLPGNTRSCCTNSHVIDKVRLGYPGFDARCDLTYGGLNKSTDILQWTLSSAFSWIPFYSFFTETRSYAHHWNGPSTYYLLPLVGCGGLWCGRYKGG